MASSTPKLTAEQFAVVEPKLIGRLTASLDVELKECALPEIGGSPLYEDLPIVDSKTVCKLSPIVQELLGRRLEPSWVRKGGYQSVDAAIKDVIANMKKDCVSSIAKFTPANSPKTAVTA